MTSEIESQTLPIGSTVGKCEKWEENNIVEITGYVDFFFQLNLQPPYSLCSQGDETVLLRLEAKFFFIKYEIEVSNRQK